MFGNRWQPQTTCAGCAYVQAIFRRRRHQVRRPPLAKIRPGSPAPTIGPGTGATGCGGAGTTTGDGNGDGGGGGRLTGALLPLVGATVGTVTTCWLGAELITAGTMPRDSGADRGGRLGGVVTPNTAEATEVLAVSNTDIVVGRSTLSGTDTGEPTEVLAVSNTDIVVGRSTLSGTDTGEPTLAV